MLDCYEEPQSPGIGKKGKTQYFRVEVSNRNKVSLKHPKWNVMLIKRPLNLQINKQAIKYLEE